MFVKQKLPSNAGYNKKIEPRKYVQVLERDVLKFGFSSREYVLLHDQSKDEEGDDLGVE